jgi:hypothetical protein
MRKVRETKIGKLTPKPHITYPLIRLPPEYTDVIGKRAHILKLNIRGERYFWLWSVRML